MQDSEYLTEEEYDSVMSRAQTFFIKQKESDPYAFHKAFEKATEEIQMLAKGRSVLK